MKLLVLGYSVTAEKNSYVEYARERLSGEGGLTVAKVGYGGLQPHDARYLFPSVIRREAPDIIVLDQATPAFRKFTSNAAEYRLCLLSVIRICQRQGIRLALLDLPRTDVDYADDWVTRLHAEEAARADIPCLRVAGRPEDVWDEVHPTETGKEHYADALVGLIAQARVPAGDSGLLANVPEYDCLELDDRAPPALGRKIFERGGDIVTMVQLDEDQSVAFDFGSLVTIRAVSYLMGPRTGYLELVVDGRTFTALAYDGFCYYERLGVYSLDPRAVPPGARGMRLTIRQLRGLPEVPLRKGDPYTGPRSGAVAHVFLERDRPVEDAA